MHCVYLSQSFHLCCMWCFIHHMFTITGDYPCNSCSLSCNFGWNLWSTVLEDKFSHSQPLYVYHFILRLLAISCSNPVNTCVLTPEYDFACYNSSKEQLILKKRRYGRSLLQQFFQQPFSYTDESPHTWSFYTATLPIPTQQDSCSKYSCLSLYHQEVWLIPFKLEYFIVSCHSKCDIFWVSMPT